MSSIVQSGISVVTGLISRLARFADNPSFNYQTFVLLSSGAVGLFEIWLLRRQIRCYSLTKPPKELESHLSEETFNKAQAYGKDKAQYSLVKLVYSQVINVALIGLGVYSKTWNLAGKIMDAAGLAPNRTISRSLLWITLLTVISSIPSLPWSYYYNFVLEEKHGFNKQTRKLWIMDQLKTYGLMAVLGLPIFGAFLKVIEWAGESFVPYLMAFMIVLIVTIQLVFPTFIQPLFNKLDPLPQGELRTKTEALAGKLGFPLKHLYVIDGSKRSSHSNAYFYGLPWSKHIVIYDTLMEKSTPSEVEAVLGHELGHWYYSHPSKLLLISQFHLLFTFTSFHVFIHNRSLFSSFGFDPRLALTGPAGGPQPVVIGFVLYQMVLEPLDSVVRFLMNRQTRKYEYQADEFAAKLDKKDDLKQALVKLHVDNLSSPHNDPLYSAYHHSHPTLPERLRAMDVYRPRGGLNLKDAAGSEKKEL